MNTPEEVQKNPLLEWSGASFYDFRSWLKAWHGSPSFAQRLGLLHWFTTKDGWTSWGNESVEFFMDIADGYSRANNFSVRGDPPGDGYKRRQMLAKKAFSVLCARLFEPDKALSGKPTWGWLLTWEALFKKALWFGRPGQHFFLHNLDLTDKEDRNQQTFRNFLADFAKLGWDFDWGGYSGEMHEKVQARLVAARPQFVEILQGLGMVEWLHNRELDGPTLAKLKELVFQRENRMSSEDGGAIRKPINIEEALRAGLGVARVLYLQEARNYEQLPLDLDAQTTGSEFVRKAQDARFDRGHQLGYRPNQP